MKIVTIFLTTVALALALPQHRKLGFRNVYMKPVDEIKHEASPRIIGGNEAEPHSVPYQAFLEVLSKSEWWYCGGSVISANYVLTAGHCGADATEAYITLGAQNPLAAEVFQVNVLSKEIIVHKDFYQSQALIINDISVMKFSAPVTFSDYLQPARLPTWADVNNTYESETSRVSGWGLQDGQVNDLAEALMYVDVSVIGNRLCERTFGLIFPSVICTSGMMNTGVCNGDSGGPLVVNGVQVGVVSFGVDECRLGYPSAYSRITRFLPWIEENTDVKIADKNE